MWVGGRAGRRGWVGLGGAQPLPACRQLLCLQNRDLFGEFEPVCRHDCQGRGADDGGGAGHSRPCTPTGGRAGQQAHQGRGAGRGSSSSSSAAASVQQQQLQQPLAGAGEAGLTPLVSSMPCMCMTAREEEHTMAAELDRPPPAACTGRQAGRQAALVRRAPVLPGAQPVLSRRHMLHPAAQRGVRSTACAARAAQRAQHAPVGTVPWIMICRPEGPGAA